jgi:predicted DNA-binding antitoxin AbrB/MazE fold protein
MSEKPYPVVEFEAAVQPNGVIRLPRTVSLKLKAGTHVTVRLSEETVAHSLRKRNVSEEEIEQIAVTQLEDRSDVIRCLKAEGSLASNRKFRQRARALVKQ